MWNSNQFNGEDKVQELSSQREISKILQVGIGTVNRDLSYLRQQARKISEVKSSPPSKNRKEHLYVFVIQLLLL